MKLTPEHCRKRAEECLERAEEPIEPRVKESWLLLGQRLLSLADQLDQLEEQASPGATDRGGGGDSDSRSAED
jgi:hypothetical protein